MILFFTDPRSADYSADYLVHGACELLGSQSVIDWPRKPSIHWGNAEPEFDCNVTLNTAIQSQDEVEQSLRDGSYDLVVVPTLRGCVPQRLYFWRELLRRNADRLVYVDGEDSANDTLPVLIDLLGFKPAAYFKREMPLGEDWATPLPFGYPAERVVSVDAYPRVNAGIYSAFLWGWVGEGLRRKLADALSEVTVTDLNGFAVIATDVAAERHSVPQEHRAAQMSLLAVSPSGQGYGCNRHLSIIADGCCPIIERPWRQWPDAPRDGIECLYFQSEVDCVDIVQELLTEPERATEMAKAAQAWLLAGHTTKHRAASVWLSVHNADPVTVRMLNERNGAQA